MSNILIVEDESLIALRIENFLKKEGYCILDTIFEFENVYKRAIEEDVDLILMDINLNDSMDDLSGIDLARMIREQSNVPIIFLTGYIRKSVMRKAIDVGNSTFLNKPWRELELLSQIEKYIGWYHHTRLDEEFTFDNERLELKRDEEIVYLDKRELELLKFFIDNKNKVMPNEAIEHSVWSDHVITDSTRIALVSKLRKKLDGRFIETLHKVGYIFKI